MLIKPAVCKEVSIYVYVYLFVAGSCEPGTVGRNHDEIKGRIVSNTAFLQIKDR